MLSHGTRIITIYRVHDLGSVGIFPHMMIDATIAKTRDYCKYLNKNNKNNLFVYLWYKFSLIFFKSVLFIFFNFFTLRMYMEK